MHVETPLAPSRSALLAQIESDLRQHQRVCLLGPSGIGKSTVLRALASILEDSVYVDLRDSKNELEQAKTLLGVQTSEELVHWLRKPENKFFLVDHASPSGEFWQLIRGIGKLGVIASDHYEDSLETIRWVYPLAYPESLALAQTWVDDSFPRAQLEFVLASGAGVPGLFAKLEQRVRLVGNAALSAIRPDHWFPFRSALGEPTAGQFDASTRASPEAKAFARAASLFDGEFSLSALAVVLGRSVSEASEAMVALIRIGIVGRTSSDSRGNFYLPPLARETLRVEACEDPEFLRTSLDRCLAELERDLPDSLWDGRRSDKVALGASVHSLLLHALRHPELRVRALRVLGHEAFAGAGGDEWLSWVDREGGPEALLRDSEKPMASELFALFSHAYRRRGNLGLADQCAINALQAAEGPFQRTQALLALTQAQAVQGEFLSAVEHTTEALSLSSQFPHYHAQLWYAHAMTMRAAGYWDEARLACESGLAVSRQIGSDVMTSLILALLGSIERDEGFPALAELRFRESIELAKQTRFYSSPHLQAASLLDELGKAEEGIAFIESVLPYLTRYDAMRGAAYFQLAATSLSLRRYLEARRFAGLAFEIDGRNNAPRGALYLAQRAAAEAGLGLRAESLLSVDAAIRAAVSGVYQSFRDTQLIEPYCFLLEGARAPEEASRWRSAIEEALSRAFEAHDGGTWFSRNADVRKVIRLASASLGKIGVQLPTTTQAWPTLYVDELGTSFRIDQGPVVKISSASGKRLLSYFASSPNIETSVEDLFAIGWPNESVRGTAGRDRVYVSIMQLRKAGLGSLLVRNENGYRLIPQVNVQIERSS